MLKEKPLKIYTIGHSNYEKSKFIEMLKSNRIEVVVDVRSNPYSRYATWFNKADIESSLKETGIKYLFLGMDVGGKPKNREFYDDKGNVQYSKIAESPQFIQGIERLMKGMKQYRVAMMCGEENPTNCHRRLLIGRVLSDKRVNVIHIRGDARHQSDDDISLENNETQEDDSQQSLFK